MSYTGQDDQINQQLCYGKDEGDGSSRIQRNDDVGNQYESDESVWTWYEYLDLATNSNASFCFDYLKCLGFLNVMVS